MGGDGDAGATLFTPAHVEQAIRDRDVSWEMLLGVGALCGLEEPERANEREVGQRLLAPAIDAYREKWGGEADLFPPVGGLYLHPDGEFNWALHKAEIRFDWSEAWPLAFQIEAMAEEVREWWPEPDEEPLEKEALLARVGRIFRRTIGSGSAAAARAPHSNRAFGLATWVMGALQQENAHHPASDSDSTPPGPTFEADLDHCQREFATAQKRFRDAIQRTAQSRYWKGAIAGSCLLALFCVVLGGIFWWRGTDAAYGVALPAGGLGAMVSLLQRMSSGKLLLDINASRDLLEVFGMVRPLIGAVFGLAVTALLIGGLVPAVEIPADQELAFFAGVGFLAGFNERWAQDMLKSSTDQVGGTPAPSLPAPGSGKAETGA